MRGLSHAARTAAAKGAVDAGRPSAGVGGLLAPKLNESVCRFSARGVALGGSVAVAETGSGVALVAALEGQRNQKL